MNVCHHGGWLAEAEISYAGIQAEARARLAGEIVRKRLGAALHARIDLIGALRMNLVLEGVLDGGVNDALNLDTHGKGLSFWLLDTPIRVSADFCGGASRYRIDLILQRPCSTLKKRQRRQ